MPCSETPQKPPGDAGLFPYIDMRMINSRNYSVGIGREEVAPDKGTAKTRQIPPSAMLPSRIAHSMREATTVENFPYLSAVYVIPVCSVAANPAPQIVIG